MEIRHSSRDSKLERLNLLDVVHNAANLIADSSLAPSKRHTLHDRERILFGQGFLAQSQIFVNETAVLLDDAGCVVSSESAVEESGSEIAFRTCDCLTFFGFCSTL